MISILATVMLMNDEWFCGGVFSCVRVPFLVSLRPCVPDEKELQWDPSFLFC